MTDITEEFQTVPFSLGIETAGGGFTKLIERDTMLPSKQFLTISTDSDNQPNISILVFQGESEIAQDNKFITQLELRGIPPAPCGVPQIEVTFDMDVNNLLTVTIQERKSMKTETTTVRVYG